MNKADLKRFEATLPFLKLSQRAYHLYLNGLQYLKCLQFFLTEIYCIIGYSRYIAFYG